MARPSSAALDVMEHIAEAIDALDGLLATMDRRDAWDVAREVEHVRDHLLHARNTGAEVVLELLNLSERHELMQGEIEQMRGHHH